MNPSDFPAPGAPLGPNDPEASPANPSGALAAQAGAAEGWARHFRGTGTSLEVWKLAWPLMLSQLLIAMVSLVDIGMVGRLGTDEQAAVGYATQFHFLTQSVYFAIGFACVARMARSIGAGDPARARAAFAASMILGTGASVAFAGPIALFPGLLLGGLGAAPELAELCAPYLSLMMVSSLLLSVALMVESGLRADRDTTTPMRIAIFVTLLKVLLNVLLIFGVWGFPRLELIGAGLATLISQVLGLSLFAVVILRASPDGPLGLRPVDFTQMSGEFGKVAHIAIPSVVERVGMNLAIFAFFVVLAGYGTVAIAAYTVGIRLLSFSWIPGIGYAQAVATLVGQALGRKDIPGARRAGWRAARLAVGTACVMAVIGVWVRAPLAELFSQDAEMIAILVPFMLAMCLCQPPLQLHFTLAGAHRGAGDTWTPLVSSLVGTWGLRVFLASVFAWLGLPIVWIWIALFADHFSRAVWLTVTFKRNSWLREPQPA